jgi:putative redox protein
MTDIITSQSANPTKSESMPQVVVTERDRKFACGIRIRSHQLTADEPQSAGGTDTGPKPHEYLLAALGSCTAMTVRMYASRKNFDLDNIEVSLNHSRINAEDCDDCESKQGLVDVIERKIRFEGRLTPDQRDKLLEIANKCPVHRTLINEILIKTTLL